MTERRSQRPPILGPVILITIGVLALMQNYGQLPASFWPTIWRLWPILLVLIGVEILLGQLRLPWAASFALALLVIGVTIGGVVYLAYQSPLEERAGVETQHVETDLQGVTSANVRLEFGAGALNIGSTSTNHIMVGDFPDTGANRRVQVDYAGSSGKGDLKVSIAGSGGWPFVASSRGNRWDINLNNSIPLDLRIEAGMSSNDFDLSALKLSALRIEAGLSSTQVRLPAAGNYTAHISCGLSTTSIVIPEGVAARVQVQSGLSAVTVNEARFVKSGDSYTSPNYETATNRVNLIVEGGLATISIQ